MLTRFIVAMLVVSFVLGFVKPQVSGQAHLVISIVTYLFVWAGVNAYEMRRQPPQSQGLTPLFWLIVIIGGLSLVAEFLPEFAQPALFIRAIVFIGGLVYCFSKRFRAVANVQFSKLNVGK